MVSISWDKKNNKFGMVYELVSGIKNDRIQYGVAFYQIVTNKDKSQNVHRIGDIKSTPTNRLVLTENGVFFGLRQHNLQEINLPWLASSLWFRSLRKSCY